MDPGPHDRTRKSRPQSSILHPPSSIFDPRSSAFFRKIAELGVQVAEALEYAHQCGVVHRDVKPANLLLDAQGHLWVTDFGLARLPGEGGVTRSGDLLGTLRYMSPEQALARRGTVDHRTDVYSLGATLYELLSLHPVFEGEDPHELLRQTTTDEPVPLRRRNPKVPSELEIIVLKTLEKDPARRYGTAQELADDLRRFLTDQPIQARRPRLRERAVKWARRHRAAVTAAVAANLVLLVAAALGTPWLWHQRNQALEDRKRAYQAADAFYVTSAKKWLADQPQLEPEQQQLLAQALAVYEDWLRGQPNDRSLRQAKANLYRRIGEIRQHLGEYADALDAQERSISLLEATPPDAGVRADAALSHTRRGDILRDTGRCAEAETAYRRAVLLFDELAQTSPEHPEYRGGLAGARNNLGNVLFALGRVSEAEAEYRRAIGLFAGLAAEHPDHPEYSHDLASGHNNLGNLLRDTGQAAEAQREFDTALALWQDLVGRYVSRPVYREGLAVVQHNRGVLFGAMKRDAAAEEAFGQALTVRRKLAEEFPSAPGYRRELSATCNAFGTLLQMKGDAPRGEVLLQEAKRLQTAPDQMTEFRRGG
jgi:tetratricopeptide (TPR) repeat protein